VSTALLDGNLLIALLWPTHQHHGAAHEWFAARPKRRWATCPLTELAFIRIVSNPAFSPDAVRPADAAALLASNVRHPRHEFWPDDLPVPPTVLAGGQSLRGHRQVMDAYLLALAVKRHGVLATFDGGVRTAAPTLHAASVEVLPLRPE
jgi:toxin-antitoxin system PIN domain toxin